MSTFPVATDRMRMTKKKFEAILGDKYEKMARETHHEDQYDGNPPIKMTLYYEIGGAPDSIMKDRHCGTWMGGECWEFLPENGEANRDDSAILGKLNVEVIGDIGDEVKSAIEKKIVDGIVDGEVETVDDASEQYAERVAAALENKQLEDDEPRSSSDRAYDALNDDPIGTRLCDVLHAVRQGQFDDDINDLIDTLVDRRKAVRAKRATDMKSSLSVGDKVFVSNVSPKYLEGITATVVDIPRRGKKVLVRLSETIRHWTEGTEVNIAASCLAHDDGGPTASDMN